VIVERQAGNSNADQRVVKGRKAAGRSMHCKFGFQGMTWTRISLKAIMITRVQITMINRIILRNYNSWFQLQHDPHNLLTKICHKNFDSSKYCKDLIG